MGYKIYLVGIGPGRLDGMTVEAARVLDACDVIVGYTAYLALLGERYADKELLSTPMRRETERCRLCFSKAREGKATAMVCSGDAGVYGMASLMYELGEEYPDCEIVVVPGVTAANSGAACLGAPLGHDYCCISLSDLLIPWEQIGVRLRAAAQGDFVIVLYNPASRQRADHLRRACDILLETIEPARPCGYVRRIGREGEEARVCTLLELRETPADMFTTVFIGNSGTRLIDGRLVTGRDYRR